MKHVGASRQADAKGVLSVIGLDIRPGDEWAIDVDGEDEKEVSSTIDGLVRSQFGETEEREGPESEIAPRIPAALKRMGASVLSGRPVSGGVGRGRAVMLGSWNLGAAAGGRRSSGPGKERTRVAGAVASVSEELTKRAQRSTGAAADLLRAHGAMIADPEFMRAIEQRTDGGNSAESAVAGASEEFASRLREAGSILIRERAADVMDLGMQLLTALGVRDFGDVPTLMERSVVLCEAPTPGQIMRLDAKMLAGLVFGNVGATSHAVILARSMGIPTVIGVEGLKERAGAARMVVVDSVSGTVILDPSEQVGRLYDLDERALATRRALIAPIVARPGTSRDGVCMEIGCNAATAADVARASAADGVGLFRTEFLYLGRDHGPSEDELFGVFRDAVVACGRRPVIFRTFDIGADKPAPFLHLAAEENPFLGERGIRLYLKHAPTLRTQIRAIVRAAAAVAGSKVRVMAPMVTNVAEAKWFLGQVRAAETNLANAETKGTPLEVGVMLEVPAAAASVGRLAAHADFFSLGTNDLAQYWNAADRGNAAVHGLASEIEPSFLAFLDRVCSEARAASKWIGMCGEMASEPKNLPLLLGLGLNEISVAGSVVSDLKVRLRGLEKRDCRGLLERAIGAEDAAQVEEMLASFSGAESGEPPIGEHLINLGCTARSKEEAIREMVGVVYGAARTDRPRDLEEDIWAREETYSTGLGFGFAVPHCRTGSVRSVTVAVARLEKGIDWGSNDGAAVRHVILLAVPDRLEAKTHLRVLAQLARRLVHEDFRGAVESAAGPREMAELLKRELGL